MVKGKDSTSTGYLAASMQKLLLLSNFFLIILLHGHTAMPNQSDFDLYDWALALIIVLHIVLFNQFFRRRRQKRKIRFTKIN